MFFGQVFRGGGYGGLIPPIQSFYSGWVHTERGKDSFDSIGHEVLDVVVELLDVENGSFIEVVIYYQLSPWLGVDVQ